MDDIRELRDQSVLQSRMCDTGAEDGRSVCDSLVFSENNAASKDCLGQGCAKLQTVQILLNSKKQSHDSKCSSSLNNYRNTNILKYLYKAGSTIQTSNDKTKLYSNIAANLRHSASPGHQHASLQRFLLEISLCYSDIIEIGQASLKGIYCKFCLRPSAWTQKRMCLSLILK